MHGRQRDRYPRRTLAKRLAAVRRVKAARKSEEERERQKRAAEIRRNVKANVGASRIARHSHGDTRLATLGYRRHEERRERGRNLVEGRLSAPELCYALPSRNLRPLHHYAQMATVMIMDGDRAPHGCLKWLEGEPVEYSRGVWVSNMYWRV